ncbi:MAG: FIST N-terminal domain-containing protein [Bacteroidia bacterium]
MHIQSISYTDRGWDLPGSPAQPALVCFFGGHRPEEATAHYEALRAHYPQADIIGCTTAGEIRGLEVTDHQAVALLIRWEQAHATCASLVCAQAADAYQAGVSLARTLPADGLRMVFVISDGHIVNGSELVKGLRETLPVSVPVSGGLAGDGGAFVQTGVVFNGPATPGRIVAVGLYGSSLRFGFGSRGGWNAFGPVRRITRSTANILYELDGRPALELYKIYLGEEVDQLPQSALRFPIMIYPPGSQVDGKGTVRTILSIDEAAQSLIFAGDVPQGSMAQLMMASFEDLIDGAESAAGMIAPQPTAPEYQRLAILVSCVGRKIVMGHRIEDEVEAVASILPPDTAIAGFYSYGEIAPHFETGTCELHNQTMTITYLTEHC